MTKNFFLIFLVIPLVIFLFFPQTILANVQLSKKESHFLMDSIQKGLFDKWSDLLAPSDKQESRETEKHAALFLIRNAIQQKESKYMLIEIPIECLKKLIKLTIFVSGSPDTEAILDEINKVALEKAVEITTDWLHHNEIKVDSGSLTYSFISYTGKRQKPVFYYNIVYHPLSEKEGKLSIEFYSPERIEPNDPSSATMWINATPWDFFYWYSKGNRIIYPFIIRFNGQVKRGFGGTYVLDGDPQVSVTFPEKVPDFYFSKSYHSKLPVVDEFFEKMVKVITGWTDNTMNLMKTNVETFIDKAEIIVQKTEEFFSRTRSIFGNIKSNFATNKVSLGKIVFVSNRDGNQEIYLLRTWQDGSKEEINLTKNSANDWNPSWSPDGKKIVFVSDRDGNSEIYTMDADGHNSKRLTFNETNDDHPSWFPDGSKIIFSRLLKFEKTVFWQTRNYHYFRLFTMNKNGGSQEQLYVNMISIKGNLEKYHHITPAVSPDGQKIAFSGGNHEFGWPHAIYVINLSGDFVEQYPYSKWGWMIAWDLFQPSWSANSEKIIFYAEKDYVGDHEGELNFNGIMDRQYFSSMIWISNEHDIWEKFIGQGDVSKLVDGSYPEYLFEGNKILYVKDGNIYLKDIDKSNQKQITNLGQNWSPDWSY